MDARNAAGNGAPGLSRLILSDGTYDAIKSMILEHRISPGQHVSIDGLARELSVSQTPVREALARLEADGLVTKLPLRGYQATALLTIAEFDDLFRFRALLEPWAAAQAAADPSPDLLAELRAELDAADRIAPAVPSETYERLVEHDTRFHTLVARMSGNGFVEAAFLRTHCHMHLFRVYKATFTAGGGDDSDFVQDLFAEYYRGDRLLAVTEHHGIATAIEAGDAERAQELMLSHIESSRVRFAPAVRALNALPA